MRSTHQVVFVCVMFQCCVYHIPVLVILECIHKGVLVCMSFYCRGAGMVFR